MVVPTNGLFILEWKDHNGQQQFITGTEDHCHFHQNKLYEKGIDTQISRYRLIKEPVWWRGGKDLTAIEATDAEQEA